MTLRVGFAGTPPFAAQALNAIVAAGYDVRIVLTRPDRPQGRGLKLTPSAVKSAAAALGLPIVVPASVKAGPDRAPILGTEIDVLVVAAYGLILPAEVLSWPRHGCINIHASLLPRWRGAAPIQRALLAGDRQTGVSIMQMDAGLDTGPVIAAVPISVGLRDTAGTLLDKLAAAGAGAIVRTLSALQSGNSLYPVTQPSEGITYAAKIGRADALIDWRAEGVSIDRQVRALNPSPGAATTFENEALKIWTAEPVHGRFGSPGTIVNGDDRAIVVACGEGALVVSELQRAGGKRMSAAAFAAGQRMGVGMKFGPSALPGLPDR